MDEAFIFVKISVIANLHTYNKTEKLKSRKTIEHLFIKGKSLSVFPIKLLYDLANDSPASLQAGVTVGSRTFKKAVQRNRVKRVLREAYRLQKLPIKTVVEERQLQVSVFFIFIGKELPVFSEVYDKLGILLNKLTEIILKKGT